MNTRTIILAASLMVASFGIMIYSGGVINKIGDAFKDAGNAVYKDVIKPTGAALETAYNETAKGVTIAYDASLKKAVDAIAQGWNAKRNIGRSLVDGAQMLAGSTAQFLEGAKQIEAIPAQLTDGMGKINNAKKEINDALAQVNKQRKEIQSRNLANLGLKALNDALMGALNSLESALVKVLTVLDRLLGTMQRVNQEITKQLEIIKAETQALQRGIDHSDISGRSLPSRMRDLGNFLLA